MCTTEYFLSEHGTGVFRRMRWVMRISCLPHFHMSYDEVFAKVESEPGFGNRAIAEARRQHFVELLERHFGLKSLPYS
jgi:hypothetical protein